MSIENLLSKLEKVKSLGHNRWLACCPAHQDKHPSMNIKLTPEGHILMICRTGCQNYDILQSIGLEFKDLYVQTFDTKKAFPAADVLEALRNETMIVSIIADRFFHKRDITAGDWLRLRQASRRILKAVDTVNG